MLMDLMESDQFDVNELGSEEGEQFVCDGVIGLLHIDIF